MTRLRAVLAMPPDLVPVLFRAAARSRLAAVADIDFGLVTGDFAEPTARDALARTEVLITGWGCPRLNAAVLSAAPRLRAIVHAAGSVRPLLAPGLWPSGVVVSSAARANAEPVAQFTLAMVLLAHKRAFARARAYAGGQVLRGYADLSLGNAGRTVGVVGASRVGRLVLPLLAAQGFRLLLADPTLAGAIPGAELTGLDELMARSDLVTLHAPALPQTYRMIDDRRLALMRDGAILVNTARGALVDTEALTRHCADGRIDAVLDVTDPEPLPPSHPLFALPNVLLTPHLAGALGTEVAMLGDFAVAEVERLAGGQPLLGEVTAADLRYIALW